MDSDAKLEAWFSVEKDTKNTIRYQEEAEGHPLVGIIYLQKGAVALLGNPARIKVTVEPA